MTERHRPVSGDGPRVPAEPLGRERSLPVTFLGPSRLCSPVFTSSSALRVPTWEGQMSPVCLAPASSQNSPWFLFTFATSLSVATNGMFLLSPETSRAACPPPDSTAGGLSPGWLSCVFTQRSYS